MLRRTIMIDDLVGKWILLRLETFKFHLMATAGHQCWVIARLPGPVHLEISNEHLHDPDLLGELQNTIANACDR